MLSYLTKNDLLSLLVGNESIICVIKCYMIINSTDRKTGYTKECIAGFYSVSWKKIIITAVWSSVPHGGILQDYAPCLEIVPDLVGGGPVLAALACCLFSISSSIS